MRRAKLYYLRDRRGKSARIVEKIEIKNKDDQKKELKVSKTVKPKSDNDDSKNLPKEDFKTKENKKESSKKEN